MLENRKVNFTKLVDYGFQKIDDSYLYQTTIVDEQFLLKVTVNDDGIFATQVIDTATKDEYVLHLDEAISGVFVGQVRTEYQAVLADIVEHCTDNEIFKAKQTQQIIEFVRATYGDELEFLWQKSPNNAIFRRSDTNKWYAAILTVAQNVLGLPGTDKIEVIDLHLPVERVQELVDHERFLPGYHMNKQHWISICLNGTVPNKIIEDLIKESYAQA